VIWKALGVRRSQGWQFVRDLRAARPPGFRGRPVIATTPCEDRCTACRDVCPTQAIALDPVKLDLGRCVFCTECVAACPVGKIAFTPDPRLAASTLPELVVVEGDDAIPAARADAAFRALFGRSLRLRQVSAGGCNGCELELAATANVNFDLQRYGIDWVASPRHADGLVLSGPLTRNMARAVRLAWDAMPAPKFVVAVGACAISGGLYRVDADHQREFLADVPPIVYVPGCPPHPLTFAHAVLDLLGR
jgi:Ni,Fe-hydrogenase III small subunit